MADGNGVSFTAFPYEPYDIQLDFMYHLYTILESGGVGLLESPTGTGKTLSIICSALQWLEDKRKRDTDEMGKENVHGQNLPSWMHKPQPLARADKSGEAGRVPPNQLGFQATERRQLDSKGQRNEQQDDMEQYLLDDGGSDADAEPMPGQKRPGHACQASSSEDDSDDCLVTEVAMPPRAQTQILFSSRTHSQLTQFVGELRRTRFAGSFRVVALASRKALCINPAVQKLGGVTRMNERCLDLQKKKPASSKAGRSVTGKPALVRKGKKSGCQYLKATGSKAQAFKEAVLGEVMDVEELGKAGKAHGVCPYYTSRSAVPHADLVLLPHSALLAQETRDALGLRLQGSVVIVDEAHNLVDAVAAAHSATLTAFQLSQASGQLHAYLERFRTRLAQGNVEQLEALLQVATAIQTSLQRRSKDAPKATALMHVNEYIFQHGLHDFNMFKLVRFVKERKLLFKVSGYVENAEGAGDAKVGVHLGNHLSTGDQFLDPGSGSTGTGPLQAFLSMLSALNNADKDGRLLMVTTPPSLHYILLNAASQFGKVVAAAHAVILASGTLSPIASLQQQLFPELPPERLHHFGCGHVVAKERLLTLALGKGPSGRNLDFRHAQRTLSATMDELGALLANICQAVPGGVVVFFPSFGYAEEVEKHWAQAGVLERLAKRKRIFKEPREAGEVEATLKEYGAHINAKSGADDLPSGAMLLCVVGAKMSEGINFGNDLARCVVVVGLPYPNPEDPELQERMRFLDQQQAQKGPAQQGAPPPGRLYYEDLCMKAVNQCVGRVIRHRDDWAAIVLTDIRYTARTGKQDTNAILSELPAWVQNSLVISSSFGDAFSKLHRFCRSMKPAAQLVH